jgi:predicted phage tail protein
MENVDLVRGSGGGGGKGGSKARAAKEAANTLQSRQIARIVDVLCEGEIEGLVGLNVSTEEAEKSIFFDGVALRNDSGVPNFDIDAFGWSFVPGTQNQRVITTGGTVASEVAVDQEVKYGNTGGGPVVRSIPETYIDACRVTVTIPRLTTQNTKNGDINGGSVEFAIDVQENGGGFAQVLNPTISGKTNSEYQRSYEFDLSGEGPWDIRVRRITPDATTSNVANQLFWSTMTKIVKQPLNYPNTAMIGLQVDSELFNRVPSRAYRLKLAKVRVPNNYNPLTRTYTGLWNGTFKLAWTDNPAWCWYDLATHDRYGLGEYIDPNSIDKWALYSIAQYCDQLVPDGNGGMEPRFTCNLLLQTREEALKVLMNFASIFRGIVYWHTNSIFCSQDRPANPVKLFTPANVEGGLFTYSGTARQARHTVCHVSWNDPDNFYKQTIEYVEDREGVLRFGVREKEVTAMGCTSRGQANRLGRWLLLTEREETDTVVFRTGLEGVGVMPGEIIQTTDPARAGDRMGGRIMSATANQITLDSPVTLQPGKTYSVSVVLPNGEVQERPVTWAGSSALTTSTLDLSVTLDQVPQQHAIWILQTNTLVPELWRVVSIVEVESGVIEITALEHVAGKYDAIEQNLVLQPRPTSSIKIVPSAVTNLGAVTDVKRTSDTRYTTRIFVSWTPPAGGATRYYVSWRRDTENFKTEQVDQPSIDLDDVTVGTYEISVAAENAIGMRGPSVTITHIVDVSTVEPDVQNLRLNPNFLGQDAPIMWDRLSWATHYTVQVLSGSTVLREETTELNEYVYTYAMNVADGGPRRALTFQVKAHSWRGASAAWATLAVNNAAPAMPVGVSVEAGPGQISVLANRPAEPDLEGMIVWMYTDDTVPTTPDNLVYQGTDNAFVKTGLQAGIPVYFKVAFYDAFGDTGLNISPSVSATPMASGGVVQVSTLPASPADIGGELAVFLNVADQDLRGLYGWDGTEWKFTRDGDNIIANSIAADKLAVANLSAISANLGTMTAGNMTLDALGFIRGGQPAFNAGSGFWMGYNLGEYKLSLGNLNQDRMTFDSSGLNVQGVFRVTDTAQTNVIANPDMSSDYAGWYQPNGSPVPLPYDGINALWGYTTTPGGNTVATLTMDGVSDQGYPTCLSQAFPVAPGQIVNMTLRINVQDLGVGGYSGWPVSVVANYSTDPGFTSAVVTLPDVVEIVWSEIIDYLVGANADDFTDISVSFYPPEGARFCSISVGVQ